MYVCRYEFMVMYGHMYVFIEQDALLIAVGEKINMLKRLSPFEEVITLKGSHENVHLSLQIQGA